MKTTMTQPVRASAPTRGPGDTRKPPDGMLDGLQRDADRSPGVKALARLADAALVPVQREVDSSPILPGHDNYEDGTLDWDKSKGVPDWAREDYAAHSGLTLMCSMKDGKIGSVYLPDGRIRTTHGSGPKGSLDKTDRTAMRFNLNIDKAWNIFASGNASHYQSLYDKTDPTLSEKKRKALAVDEFDRAFKRWLSEELISTPTKSLPSWVRPVTGPETAHDPESGPEPEGLSLFEVFRKVGNGRVAGWHPSRGVAAKFETNKQVMSVLNAALAHIEGVKDVGQRNAMFYDFILHRVPDFAAQIRAPDEI